MGHSVLAHSIPESCSISGLGPTSIYEAINTGALRAVKRGRRTLILHEDLLRYVQSLPPVVAKSIEQSTHERSDAKALSNTAASLGGSRKRGIAS
jgi:hypothetical protein